MPRRMIGIAIAITLSFDSPAAFATDAPAPTIEFGAPFGGNDTPIFHTLPAKSPTPGITRPDGIKGRGEALEISDWQDGAAIVNWLGKAAKQPQKVPLSQSRMNYHSKP